ncbi:MAG: cupin domain-containing protein [Gammaproteobacteria bacterium]
MPADDALPRIDRAECVLPAGADLAATLRFFIDELGFRLDNIYPADDPACARLSGHGLRLGLDRAHHGNPGTLRLQTEDRAERSAVTAPNGTRIEFVPADPPLSIPEPRVEAFIQAFDDAGWTRGRAGMLYRDLVPERVGGYLIASHIRIPDGGPVADHVHHHGVRFQFIYCRSGWVRLVYEDQGDPFVMHAGDCVLQPPHIRHRVLEASEGLEVIELACPAAHMTYIDHEMTLPTGYRRPRRDYGGQTFVLHRAKEAHWSPRSGSAFEVRDPGLKDATHGRVDVHVLRLSDADSRGSELRIQRRGSFAFLFVLQGALEIELDNLPRTRLGVGGSCVIPAASRLRLDRYSPDLEVLEVDMPPTGTSPAGAGLRPARAG